MITAISGPLASYAAQHLRLDIEGGVATLTLNRPERKNPLTFDSYAEMAAILRAATHDDAVKAFVVTGAGGNFCSGGDVHEIIGPLLDRDTKGLMQFTAMTGELVKAMRACPQPIIAAIDGIAAGAGAIIAMASDIRLGTARAKTAFLFNRVGLAGCDMGACAILPRIIGQGRASELLYLGRSLGGEEALAWGFFNAIHEPDVLQGAAAKLAREIAEGPNFAHAMTKRMLQMEWAMSLDQAIEAEAVAQALCMTTQDFRRAYDAFVAKQRPQFKGD
ncbi:enoyl-CoA hydratase family protein [Falsiroseomonas stagni]|uniref:Enoyl-CoA hydratase/carnithine racemase n=1 Tax=Falsiroseomonas stagni DSM 19981 TaxID=1123062 RepID=A0A1I4CFS0_9PROT|nr:enoyl-CoA hydratase family protein [Falsiroseomonas stagni]SFK79460.1 Enoyl-CoA hydratase/carnithine racemase [Falsiroseomonas stagni DSM 19981]